MTPGRIELIEQRFRVPESRGEFIASCWLESSYAAGVLLFLASMIFGGEIARAWSFW